MYMYVNAVITSVFSSLLIALIFSSPSFFLREKEAVYVFEKGGKRGKEKKIHGTTIDKNLGPRKGAISCVFLLHQIYYNTEC